MFDDHGANQPNGNVPPNLPIGEPEDIFAGTESTNEKVRPTGDAVMDQTSALEAGVLRAKNENAPVRSQMQPNSTMRPTPSNPAVSAPVPAPENYDLKEPGIGKFIFKLFIVVIVVAILGGVGWFAYTKLVKQPAVDVVSPTVSEQTEVTEVSTMTTPTEEIAPVEGENSEKINEMAGDIQDDAILFGAPVDKDGDNIDDTREVQIGTDPNNWDTDEDGLSDGDEILIWQTDPLKSDTDGDTYPDGSEVKNGYSPRGPGKLFAPPTTTTSTVGVNTVSVPSAVVATSTVVSTNTATVATTGTPTNIK